MQAPKLTTFGCTSLSWKRWTGTYRDADFNPYRPYAPYALLTWSWFLGRGSFGLCSLGAGILGRATSHQVEALLKLLNPNRTGYGSFGAKTPSNAKVPKHAGVASMAKRCRSAAFQLLASVKVTNCSGQTSRQDLSLFRVVKSVS